MFVSSTAEDLRGEEGPGGGVAGSFRAAARDAVLRAGCRPEMQEYWVAKDNPPLQECLERVDGTEVLVVIVAHWYGWEPEDQSASSADERKSITWLECERAVKNKREVLAFVVDEQADWPCRLLHGSAHARRCRSIPSRGRGCRRSATASDRMRRVAVICCTYFALVVAAGRAVYQVGGRRRSSGGCPRCRRAAE